MKKNIWPWLILALAICGGTIVFGAQLYQQRRLAHLYVSVSGSQAEIYLDEQKLGIAPIKDWTTQAGFHQLKIITDNYTYSTPLRLSPRTATIVDWQTASTIEQSSGLIYELIPLANPQEQKNKLTLQTIPDRALLALSHSKQTEFTPYQTDQLLIGNYQAELSLPGYQNLSFPFTLTNGYQLKVTAKLAQVEPK